MESIFENSMNKKQTIRAWISFYQELLMKGRIDTTGGAYKRLVQLQTRYANSI